MGDHSQSWTTEEETFLRSNYGKMSYAQIAKSIGRSTGAVKARASFLGITISRHWTKEQKHVVIQKWADNTADSIAKEIGRPISSVYKMATKFGLEKSDAFWLSESAGRFNAENNTRGNPTRFQKGNVPANKGKNQPYHPNSAATRFKPGNRPKNYLPVGSEVISTEGYRKIKVADPDVWEFVHRKVWIEANGPVPEGTMIRFKDGDRLNCDLDNLELETRIEHVLRHSIHKYPEELLPTVVTLATLRKEIRNHASKEQNR